MARKRQIYEEAVSQLKQAEFHGIFGKRSAAEYMKSENHVGKLTGDAAQYMWPSGQIYEEADLKFKSASSFVPRTGLEPAHHL